MFKCDCDLCREIAGLSCQFAEKYAGIIPHRIIAETSQFVVMPSIGQLGDAHIMLVSKAHWTAAAQLEGATLRELIELLERTRRSLQLNVATNVIVFENGDPEGRGNMACSISHLHVHLVASRRPMNGLHPVLKSAGAEPVEALASIHGAASPYSFVDLPQNGALVIRHRLPSQLLRRVIARELGTTEWDWRKAFREEQLVKIVRSAPVEFSVHESRAA